MTVSGLDPEMLIEAIRGARIEPCLLGTQPALSSIARLMCPRVCLDFATLGPSLHLNGEMARSCYTLIFVLASSTKARSFNFASEYTDGYMAFYPPGSVADAVTPEGYANATLTVPVADFHTALMLHFPEIPEKVLRSGAGMRIGEVEQTRLRRLLAPLQHSMWNAPEFFSESRVRRQIEGELLAAFLAAMRSGCADLVPPPTHRAGGRLRRLRKAREFLAAHSHEPVGLDDLCTALGLSRRGVENLFQDLLGISPITYLRHQHLHGARSALLKAAPGPGAVKSAALEWGFLHQGRFARDYYVLFGEKPSETLRRSEMR